jgi:hypothetical protein
MLGTYWDFSDNMLSEIEVSGVSPAAGQKKRPV